MIEKQPCLVPDCESMDTETLRGIFGPDLPICAPHKADYNSGGYGSVYTWLENRGTPIPRPAVYCVHKFAPQWYLHELLGYVCQNCGHKQGDTPRPQWQETAQQQNQSGLADCQHCARARARWERDDSKLCSNCILRMLAAECIILPLESAPKSNKDNSE